MSEAKERASGTPDAAERIVPAPLRRWLSLDSWAVLAALALAALVKLHILNTVKW